MLAGVAERWYRSQVILLERACSALASLVRDEYPDHYTLAEIADTWGVNITPEQVEALRVMNREPDALRVMNREPDPYAVVGALGGSTEVTVA